MTKRISFLFTLSLLQLALLNNPCSAQTRQVLIQDNSRTSDLNVGRFLLKDRHNLDAALGSPESVDPRENCESGEREYAYKDDSYACVKNGIVTLLGYKIRGAISSPSDLPRSLGLQQSADPIRIGPVAYVWAYERGNPLTVGDRYIPSATLAAGVIEIDMHGWEKIKRKSVPEKHQAMVQEFANHLDEYYPGLIEAINLNDGLVVTVKDRWTSMSTDQRLSFVKAVHEGWAREGATFGVKGNVDDKVILRHYLSGRELAIWSPLRGARIDDDR